MHLADGVLSAPVLATTSALSLGGLLVGLRRLTEDRLPLAALLGAAFFVASTIHVPVGVGSVHLVLNGLAGLLLGWVVFPVFFVALLLQAALFSFGGFSVLGTNLLIMAVPALAAHYVGRVGLRPAADGSPAGRARLLATGVACGIVGVGGAALIASAALAASGGALFDRLVSLFLVAHLPVFVVDAVISGSTLALLARLAPQALPIGERA